MKHSWSMTLLLVGCFLASQLIGIAVLDSYLDREATIATGIPTYDELPSIAGTPIERPDFSPTGTLFYVIIAVGLGTLLFLWLFRMKKLKWWKVLYFFAVWVGLTIAIGAFLPAAWIIALLAAAWKVLRPNVFIHNITELFIYGGIAAIFSPLFTPGIAVLLLLAISAYDAYAVWKSGHMVQLAVAQGELKIFSGLLFGTPPRAPTKKASVKKGTSAVLGGGDMAFPLFFIGALLPAIGVLGSVIVAVLTSLALLLLFFFARKGKFYPAMPFLTAGCFIGWGLAVLL